MSPATDRPSPGAMVAWDGLLRAHRRLVDRLDAELTRQAGLSLEAYDVLYQLSAAPGARRRMTDLAGGLLISRSSSTRLVDRLVARGLVERTPDPADRRVVWVTLTAEGRRAQRRAGRIHLRGIANHFEAALTPAEVATLASALGRLAAGD